MADPLERLTNLIALLLETTVPLTLERISYELAGQYPDELVAKRGAFERDKSVLRAEGIPIETRVLHDGATGYLIDRSRYELGDLGLTGPERHALQLAVAAIHLGVDWGGDALLKLDATDSDDISAAPVATLPALPALPALFEANGWRATVAFEYRGKSRRLDPYGLLCRDGFWYVVGYEHNAADERTFRVDRIVGDVIAGEPDAWQVPVGFDPARAIVADPRLFGDGEPAAATVWVDSHRAASVRREVGDASVVEERADGSIVVTVPCTNLLAFRSWVLGLLEHGEVLTPAHARSDIIDWLETMAG